MTKEELRRQIDAVDLEMRSLFLKRMQFVKEISDIKEKQGLPVGDSDRERALIASLTEGVCDEFLPAYSSFVFSVLSASKRYQASRRREALAALPYPVVFRTGALADVGSCFDLNRRVLVVTDDGVPDGIVKDVCGGINGPVVVTLPRGERSKTPETAARLLQTMAENDFDRHDCLVAVGGGTVSDLTGFAASLYMRGVEYYTVPTTLLAQTDASVGGKTAVDFAGVKNMIGSFYPPKGVWIDPSLTDSLSSDEYANGMAEIIKMFAALDRDLFEKLERGELTKEEMVRGALECKARIVLEDEKENGLRRVLNFGHTVGHAVELSAGLTHGQAVGIGMLCVTSGEVRRRIGDLLKRYGLPVSAAADKDETLRILRGDKKKRGDVITVVRVDEIGCFRFEDVTPESLVQCIEKGMDWQ